MSGVCPKQHKFHTSHHFLSSKKTHHLLREVDIPPRKVGSQTVLSVLNGKHGKGFSEESRNKHLYEHLQNKSLVHVDDLTSAHILLFENPDAKGRYICSLAQVSLEEMSQFLSAKYPEYQIPTADSLKGIESQKTCGYSTEKLLKSGFEFKHGLEDMLDGAIESCREKGFL